MDFLDIVNQFNKKKGAEDVPSNQYDNGSLFNAPVDRSEYNDNTLYNPLMGLTNQVVRPSTSLPKDANYYAHQNIEDLTKTYENNGLNVPAPEQSNVKRGFLQKYIFDPLSALGYGVRSGVRSAIDGNKSTHVLPDILKGIASGYTDKYKDYRVNTEDVRNMVGGMEDGTKKSMLEAGLNLPTTLVKKFTTIGKLYDTSKQIADVTLKEDQKQKLNNILNGVSDFANNTVWDIASDPSTFINGTGKAVELLQKGSKGLEIGKDLKIADALNAIQKAKGINPELRSGNLSNASDLQNLMKEVAGLNDSELAQRMASTDTKLSAQGMGREAVNKVLEKMGVTEEQRMANTAQYYVNKAKKMMGGVVNPEGLKILDKEIVSPETLAKLGDTNWKYPLMALGTALDPAAGVLGASRIAKNLLGDSPLGKFIDEKFLNGSDAFVKNVLKENPEQILNAIAAAKQQRTLSETNLFNKGKWFKQAEGDMDTITKGKYDIKNIAHDLETPYTTETAVKKTEKDILNPSYELDARNWNRRRLAEMRTKQSALANEIKKAQAGGASPEDIVKMQMKLAHYDSVVQQMDKFEAIKSYKYGDNLNASKLYEENPNIIRKLPDELLSNPDDVLSRSTEQLTKIVKDSTGADDKSAEMIAVKLRTAAENLANSIDESIPGAYAGYKRTVTKSLKDMIGSGNPVKALDDTSRKLVDEIHALDDEIGRPRTKVSDAATPDMLKRLKAQREAEINNAVSNMPTAEVQGKTGIDYSKASKGGLQNISDEKLNELRDLHNKLQLPITPELMDKYKAMTDPEAQQEIDKYLAPKLKAQLRKTMPVSTVDKLDNKLTNTNDYIDKLMKLNNLSPSDLPFNIDSKDFFESNNTIRNLVKHKYEIKSMENTNLPKDIRSKFIPEVQYTKKGGKPIAMSPNTLNSAYDAIRSVFKDHPFIQEEGEHLKRYIGEMTKNEIDDLFATVRNARNKPKESRKLNWLYDRVSPDKALTESAYTNTTLEADIKKREHWNAMDYEIKNSKEYAGTNVKELNRDLYKEAGIIARTDPRLAIQIRNTAKEDYEKASKMIDDFYEKNPRYLRDVKNSYTDIPVNASEGSQMVEVQSPYGKVYIDNSINPERIKAIMSDIKNSPEEFKNLMRNQEVYFVNRPVGAEELHAGNRNIIDINGKNPMQALIHGVTHYAGEQSVGNMDRTVNTMSRQIKSIADNVAKGSETPEEFIQRIADVVGKDYPGGAPTLVFDKSIPSAKYRIDGNTHAILVNPDIIKDSSSIDNAVKMIYDKMPEDMKKMFDITKPEDKFALVYAHELGHYDHLLTDSEGYAKAKPELNRLMREFNSAKKAAGETGLSSEEAQMWRERYRNTVIEDTADKYAIKAVGEKLNEIRNVPKLSNELQKLVSDAGMINEVALDSLKKGNITDYPASMKGASKRDVNHEQFAELGSLLFHPDQTIRQRTEELLGGDVVNKFYNTVAKVPKADIETMIPKAMKGSVRDEYVRKMKNLHDVLSNISPDVLEKVKSLEELKTKIDDTEKLFADNDNLIKQFEASGEKTTNQKWKHVVDFEEELVTKDNTLNTPEKVKEIVERYKQQNHEFYQKEKIYNSKDLEELDNYMVHVLNPELKKTAKGRAALKAMGIGVEDPFNTFTLTRRYRDTVENINKVMKEKYGIDNFFIENAVQAQLYRAFKHEDLMYRQKSLDNFINTFGHRIIQKKDYNNLVYVDSGLKVIDGKLQPVTEETEAKLKKTLEFWQEHAKEWGYEPQLAKLPSTEVPGKKFIHKSELTGAEGEIPFEWTPNDLRQQVYQYQNGYEDFINSKLKDNYAIVSLNPEFSKTPVRVVSDKSMEKAVSSANDVREIIRLTKAQVDGAETVKPFGEFKPSDFSIRNLFEASNDGYVLMPKSGIEGYTKTMEKQFMRDKNGLGKMLDKLINPFKAMAVFSGAFHVTNAIGNTFNSMMEIGAHFLDPEKIWTAQKLISGKGEGSFAGYTYEELRKMISEAGFHNDTQFNDVSGAIKFANGEEDTLLTDNPLKRLAKEKLGGTHINPFKVQGNIMYNANRKLGSAIEENAKVVNFLTHLQAGKSADEAIDLTNKVLFDYSDLTDFEHDVMRRLMPFYTFMRKNIPLQINQIAEHPERYRAFNYAYKNAQANMTKQEEALTPDDAKKGFYLGNGKWARMNLPVSDLEKLGSPKDIISSLNPLIKLAVELSTNQNTYFGTPIAREGEQTALPKYLDDTINAITIDKGKNLRQMLDKAGLVTDTSQGTMVDKKFAYALKSLLPLGETYNKVREGTYDYKPIRTTQVDFEAEKKNAMYKYIQELQDKLDNAKQYGTVTYPAKQPATRKNPLEKFLQR